MHSQAYLEAIDSHHWRNLRMRAIVLGGAECKRCGVKPKEHWRLQLHHKHYRTLGYEELEDVEVLCVSCHDEADAEREKETAKRTNRKRAGRAGFKALVEKFMDNAWEHGEPICYEEAREQASDWLDEQHGR